jgi:hypothetical protein
MIFSASCAKVMLGARLPGAVGAYDMVGVVK